MKNIKSWLKLLAGIGTIACLHGCKKDNYASPNIKFTGNVVYKGQPIGVKNNGGGTVYFELWQSGFGKSGPIDIFLNQDGSFSALLFNGNYQLIFPTSQGPFVSSSDTIPLTLSGNQTMDIEVTPYYLINNAQFSLATDSTVTASCSVSQIIQGENAKSIESIALFVNRTSFVDDDNEIARASVNGADITNLNSIHFTTKIPTNINNGNIGVANQNYFYARIGLKISGVDDMIFSDIQKIEF
ncbi:hypothetical protein A9P82_12645 [Arachidicoccus ginsenosidimutans]|uniref:DUF3823 domain-containing protein n=1 Tax=Arachidicoccus sp. BS20 TaxID=1850526 RepID=UPI0007F0AD5F|nr:DUF3823 domain-containing protein [Arachidicoccus sp. BS20]ANI90058.1 hypothetical protein A9P82_12645 [Arachidicoccus sp. BS20]